jgi:hypothetical protein
VESEAIVLSRELAPLALLPAELPALADPAFRGAIGPYAHSRLRDVCGTRINRYARPR